MKWDVPEALEARLRSAAALGRQTATEWIEAAVLEALGRFETGDVFDIKTFGGLRRAVACESVPRTKGAFVVHRSVLISDGAVDPRPWALSHRRSGLLLCTFHTREAAFQFGAQFWDMLLPSQQLDAVEQDEFTFTTVLEATLTAAIVSGECPPSPRKVA